MDWADIVLIFTVALAMLCGAAALPRGLLTVAVFTLIATVAVVVLLEVAPTRTASPPVIVVDHSR